METGMGYYDRVMAYGLILLILVVLVVGVFTLVQQHEARP
jgi:hypothetical protein